MWRLDLTDGPSQLVTLTLHLFQVNIVAVPCSQWRLRIHEVDMGMLHCGLMRHLGGKKGRQMVDVVHHLMEQPR